MRFGAGATTTVLIRSGGRFFDEAFYQDTWQFDLVNERWALLPMPGRGQPRCTAGMPRR